MFRYFITIFSIVVSVSANASESIGPKEIIEKSGPFSGWKEMLFKPEFLQMGFIYGKLENEISNPTVGSQILIKTNNHYLPNNFYTRLSSCMLVGSISRISEYSKTRYEIETNELTCQTKEGHNTYKIVGFVNGNDNLPGLTSGDFKNYKSQDIYIFLLPSNYKARN